MSEYKQESLHINQIFPTVVGIYEDFMDQEDNAIIINSCHDVSNKVSLQHDKWISKEKSPRNTFHSYNVHKDKNFETLFNKLNILVKNFSNINGDSLNYSCTNSWFNMYNNDNYQEPHTHTMSTYSVVYYPLVPEGSGKIVFLNSSISELGLMHSDSDSWTVQPKERMAIIFRSNLRHFVLHGTNKEDRMSIAANYVLDLDQYSNLFK